MLVGEPLLAEPDTEINQWVNHVKGYSISLLSSWLAGRSIRREQRVNQMLLKGVPYIQDIAFGTSSQRMTLSATVPHTLLPLSPEPSVPPHTVVNCSR